MPSYTILPQHLHGHRRHDHREGGHTAILLPNGKVLMVAVMGLRVPNVAAAELYDPASRKFTAAGAYVGRGGCDFCAPAILLADGKVLFPGQYPAQLYDPLTDSFSPSGMMITDPSAATLLTNGKVLFAGGESPGRLSSAELYDPETHTFASTGSMAWRRVWHSLTLLPNGMALAAGGETDTSGAILAGLPEAWSARSFTILQRGSFLRQVIWLRLAESMRPPSSRMGECVFTGGSSYGGIGIFLGSLASAELYTPDVLVPALHLFLFRDGEGKVRSSTPEHPTSPRLTIRATAGEILDISCTA